jgi:GMP synthase-like glutamine amidotransferase
LVIQRIGGRIRCFPAAYLFWEKCKEVIFSKKEVVLMILIIKNIEIEGPERLGSFFTQKGFLSTTVDLSRGERLPKSCENIEAVVCLGGPMNVDEEERYPYLKEEKSFIQQILAEDIPFLGICLGAQLLARACGAAVGKSPVKELGFLPVNFTEKGREDPLFLGMGESITVFQWHEDMFDIPDQGILLATASGCPHQAFRVGRRAYGVQFHIEITDESIRSWSDEYFSGNDSKLQQKKADMLQQYGRGKTAFHALGDRLFANFVSMMKDSRQPLLR